MNSKVIFLLFILSITINSASFHSLRSEVDQTQSFDVQLIHTSSRQILKLPSSRQVQLLTVPDGYQFYSYSSGQCCLQSVFNYYQFPTSPKPYKQDFFFRDSDFDQDNFTTPEHLVEQAQLKLNNETTETQRNAFQLVVRQRITNNELESYIDRQIPIILLITKSAPKRSGSYVIVIGYDSENYYFQDPYYIRSISYLPKAALEKQWRAYIQSENRQTNRLGIIINFRNGRRREVVPTVRPLP